jgi:hypothetical protein
MHAQVVDIRRNIPAPSIRCEYNLLHAKHGCRQRGNPLLLELTACLQTLPGGWNLDADTTGVKTLGEMSEVRDYS